VIVGIDGYADLVGEVPSLGEIGVEFLHNGVVLIDKSVMTIDLIVGLDWRGPSPRPLTTSGSESQMSEW
jgi:hypothetical protein